ncbi:MAG: hypothetical protein IT308_07025 [Anaerolineaceae bacterium]|nr:hypothetical protein [Anaerolineaceae bacterium]
MPQENNDQAALLKEQLFHALDLMRSDVKAVSREQAHDRDLSSRRLSALETTAQDHETRLRDVHKGVTEFRFLVGLSGGSVILAVIALIKSFLS